MHWPCLFPQVGPGPKHLRTLVFEPWQRAIAIDSFPDQLVRGLIHSDGSRFLNRVSKRDLDGNVRRYEYPRYTLTNLSTEIRELFIEACGQLGVDARHSNEHVVSVARRPSVAILDRIIGPKL
jgi:hypothetical protein